jgi:hypothetical protein
MNMKRLFKLLSVMTAVALLTGGTVFALDITVYDLNSSANTGWYGKVEDQETEPGMVHTQVWDMEAFIQNGNMLNMVGGYDFVKGEWGDGQMLKSGDLFIDVTGDAYYADYTNANTAGNKTVQGNFGYDYVLDMNFDNFTYDVYSLDASAYTITSFERDNQGSNPWRYASGGTYIKSGTFGYQTGLTDAQTGFLGGSHNMVSGIDISFLSKDIPVDFVAHFTMACGNDNLIGKGQLAALPPPPPPTSTPEPATMFLLGSGLIGLAGLKKRFNKKN